MEEKRWVERWRYLSQHSCWLVPEARQVGLSASPGSDGEIDASYPPHLIRTIAYCGLIPQNLSEQIHSATLLVHKEVKAIFEFKRIRENSLLLREFHKPTESDVRAYNIQGVGLNSVSVILMFD